MTDYDDALRTLREKLARKARAESALKSLRAQLAELKAQEKRLADILREEQADVDRLEKPSLTAFFYAVMNRKEEKLEKEKAEAYAAAVKRQAAVRQIETVIYDIGSLEAELSELTGIETQYDRVYAQKTAAVKAADPERAAEICRIEDRLDDIRAQTQEIDEALSAGWAALDRITGIEDQLSSAEGWGTLDLLGGGILADLAKHSHLDDAQAQIDELQDLLRRYHTELADVAVQAGIQAQIGGFLRFADYFFDGLFADWAVLDSIHGSQQQIADTRAQVEQVQDRLEALKATLSEEAGRLKAQLEDTVLKA